MFKSLFKSLKFTIAFIVMLVIIIVLTVLLISFLPKKGNDGTDITASQIETFTEGTGDDESSTIESTTVVLSTPTNVSSTDEHTLPLIDEEIAENGSLKINDDMETKGGIIFHKLPVFDSVEAEGNVVNYRGTYPVIGKRFVMYKEKPTIMYHTSEGYFVTSNTDYVTYTAQMRSVSVDSTKVTTYGYNDTDGIILTIYAEDGNHLIFTLATDEGATQTPILSNVIAKYDAFGTAKFEYVLDGTVENGQIEFKKENGAIKGVTVTFAETVLLDTIEVKELSLAK